MEEKTMEFIGIKARLRSPECMPSKAHPGDAGFDLRAFEDRLVWPGETAVVDTGCAVELPEEDGWIWEAQVRPRSGMSLRTPVRIANAPGTIDSGFRDFIGVIVSNTGNECYSISKGDRIAQLVVARIPRVAFFTADELGESDRGANGYGSTGR